MASGTADLGASDGSRIVPAPYSRLSPVDGHAAIAGVTLASFLHAGQELSIMDVPSGTVRHSIRPEQPSARSVTYRVTWLVDGRVALLPAANIVQADCFPPDAPEIAVYYPR
jgi:hypothetical protein